MHPCSAFTLIFWSGFCEFTCKLMNKATREKYSYNRDIFAGKLMHSKWIASEYIAKFSFLLLNDVISLHEISIQTNKAYTLKNDFPSWYFYTMQHLNGKLIHWSTHPCNSDFSCICIQTWRSPYLCHAIILCHLLVYLHYHPVFILDLQCMSIYIFGPYIFSFALSPCSILLLHFFYVSLEFYTAYIGVTWPSIHYMEDRIACRESRLLETKL